MTTLTDYMMYVSKMCQKISGLTPVNRIAAMHIYETVLDGWISYCHDMGIDTETMASMVDKITSVRPVGVA